MLTKQERAVLAAIADQLGATWKWGRGPDDADLRVGRKRIAVDIRALERCFRGSAAMPRLRFDKVVVRLMDRLRATAGKIVPDGTTVVLTVTAPIRLASQTATELEDIIATLARRRSPGRDVTASIHGNRVRIRLLRHGAGAPRLIGFVHNPDPAAALLLLGVTALLLEWS